VARSRLSPRKLPRQRRSRETVDAILEAGARVFAERGYQAGSTNRIAEAAGVSIGSLYEYFPNKEAILVALAERRLEQMVSEIETLLAASRESAESVESLLQRFVSAMLEVHERDPHLHRLVFAEAPHPPELHACVLQTEESLAHAVEALLRGRPELSLPDPDTAAHLVVQTVEALTHRFVHHGIHDLAREAFIAEVVALLTGYLERPNPQ
jgi:AcrR family transcriptional regulator